MPNPLYRNRIINQIDFAVREARAAKLVEHSGMIGHIRELAASMIIDPFLTAEYGIGSGKVTDVVGNLSDETDIIIYNKTILPAVMYSERSGVFPVEACFYAIEVKSKASAQNIQDAIEKGRNMLKLEYELGRTVLTDRRQVIRKGMTLCFFAFDSDLSSPAWAELERYAKYDPESDSSPVLRAICIAGRGYWYFDGDRRGWVAHQASDNHDEVIEFVSGIANTLAMADTSERQALLGHYLMEIRDTVIFRSKAEHLDSDDTALKQD